MPRRARWVAVARCRAGRPGPSDRASDAAESARPDRRRVGARIYFRAVESTSHRLGSRLDDTRANSVTGRPVAETRAAETGGHGDGRSRAACLACMDRKETF